VTPDGLNWLNRNGWIQRLDPDVLIVDESSYFRHTTSQRYKHLRDMLPRFRRRYILTGTPIPKGYEDLWPQVYILDEGGALGRYITHYRMKYFQDVGYGFPKYELLPGAEAAINEKIRPLVLRQDALDYIDLPALVHNQITVQLPKDARGTYEEMEKKFYLALGSEEVLAPNAAVMGGKLRQICNGFVYSVDHTALHLHDEKLDALGSLINDLAGHPAMLFYEFDADRDKILRTFPQAVMMAGSTKHVDDIIARFNRGEISILVAHPKSAGHGLNLQRGGAVIFYGPTWDCELHEQSIARVWRQGNTNERVFVHTIVAENTIEERVASVLAQKAKTQKDLLFALKRAPLPVVLSA
jgi:SNF2 family DNA or RNA helicase